MDWTDEYREIVEFYFWEPQHIGRAASGKRFKTADEMYAHVNELEVSLNHVLNIFFSLYPIYKLDCFEADETNVMLSSWKLEEYARMQKNATQPDLFFVGTDNNIAVELKTKSKTSLEQLAKYIKFNNAISNGDAKPLRIYFLSKVTDVNRVFKEKFESINDIHTALRSESNLRPDIKLISYNDLYISISKVQTSEVTESRLVGGLLSYLSKRSNELQIIIQ